MSPGLAAIGGVAFALIVTAGDAMAQAPASSVGPGARVRITISATLTPREMSAIAGAEDGPAGTSAGERTFSVRTRDNRELALPVPGARFEGVLLAVDEQLLSIETDGIPTALTVPRRAIGKLERAAGRRSRARYAGFGAIAGMGVGAMASQASINCSETWCLVPPALPGAILGTGIGAIVGAIVPPAVRWSSVDVASLSKAGAQLLTVDYGVITASAVAAWHHGPLLVGAGPALHTARARQMPGSFDVP